MEVSGFLFSAATRHLKVLFFDFEVIYKFYFKVISGG